MSTIKNTHEVKHLPTADIIMGGTEEECNKYINGVLPAGDYIVQKAAPSPATLEGEQFTPGEWQIYKSDDFKRPYSIIIPHSLKILNGSKPKTLAISIENKEDALVMAASKDLYYALKPFKLLAEEVLDVKDQPQIIYEFNGAKITTEDLSNVLKALLKASPNTL